MHNLPNMVYNVRRARKAGWPTRRESHGHGASIVVSERESRLQGEVRQVEDTKYHEVSEMLETQNYLELVRERGKAGKDLERMYRRIKDKNLLLMAYAKLYANQGATTPGVDQNDTVDGTSEERIENIIRKLDEGTYRWKPVKRVYIEKKNSSKLRPLGVPGWQDKLVQEVVRNILETYYEPQFRNSSYGFRPERGCHTALTDVYYKWKGIKWFIEGDIKGCFDNIDHEKLLEIIGNKVKDNRLLKLIRGMLKAGYVEDWKYNKTYSGTPQGGIISPLLANIILNELDKFMEDVIIPKYAKGNRRKRKGNPIYGKWTRMAIKAKKEGDRKKYKLAMQERRKFPVYADGDSRAIKYVRYADDFLIGVCGTKKDCEAIKREVGEFLETLKLKMSEEKTLITHATTEKAKFLGYHIGTIINSPLCNSRTGKRRSLNGSITLRIPDDVPKKWIEHVSGKDNIVIPQAQRVNDSDYDIIMAYEMEVQGLINYYSMAHDVVGKMKQIRSSYEESLIKTLAAKHKCSCQNIKRKFGWYTTDGRRVIAVKVEREGKKPLMASFGKTPIQRKKEFTIKDEIEYLKTNRTELISRLLNDTCELCGSKEKVSGHHVRKLADLKKRYQGKTEPPKWIEKMIAINRKTLFVCESCHHKIHQGIYDGERLT
jgi:group II intron reverse transcriptase/maturase